MQQQLRNLLLSATVEEVLDALSEEWLNSLLPGMSLLAGCDQGTGNHLEGDVAVHTALVFANIQVVARRRLGREADLIERLAALLHDLKKPQTRQEAQDATVSFPGHEAMAAREVAVISKRLRLRKEDTARLHFVISRHGQAHDFPALSREDADRLRQSPYRESLALLQEADAVTCLSSNGRPSPVYWTNLMS